MEGYAAQPFPGPIDRGLLPQGRAVYAQACAACHGVYDDRLTQPRLVSFPNRTGDIGTDPDRARLSTPALIDAVNGGLFGQYITARTTTTYAAPPLAGIWARARYLHNGSVPTLWHLMRPALRPRTFEVGGHKLDLATVGLDLVPPADYVSWSQPVTVDTTLFGLSNAGQRGRLCRPVRDRDERHSGISQAVVTAPYVSGLANRCNRCSGCAPAFSFWASDAPFTSAIHVLPSVA
jgi:hypothetical protein